MLITKIGQILNSNNLVDQSETDIYKKDNKPRKSKFHGLTKRRGLNLKMSNRIKTTRKKTIHGKRQSHQRKEDLKIKIILLVMPRSALRASSRRLTKIKGHTQDQEHLLRSSIVEILQGVNHLFLFIENDKTDI